MIKRLISNAAAKSAPRRQPTGKQPTGKQPTAMRILPTGNLAREDAMADGAWSLPELAPGAAPACLLHSGEVLPGLALIALRCTARFGPATAAGADRVMAEVPAMPPAETVPAVATGHASPSAADGWLLPPDRIDLPGRILSPTHMLR